MGAYSDTLVTDFDSAIRSLNDIQYMMRFDDPKKEFVGQQVNDFKQTHQYRLQQRYKGVTVFGKQLVVTTDDAGKITALSGDYDPLTGVMNEEMNISAEQAYALISDGFSSVDQTPERVVYTIEEGYNEYAWMFSGTDQVFVSAVDGTVLLSYTNLITDQVPVTGRSQDVVGERSATFNTVQDSDKSEFYFFDSLRNIYYSDLRRIDSDKGFDLTTLTGLNQFLNDYVLTDNDNIWGAEANKAITLYKNLSRVYDYYVDSIGIDSYNNKHGKIYAYVNDGFDSGNNAYSDGPHDRFKGAYRDRYYGNNMSELTILSFGWQADYQDKLDVVGHEFTHSIQGSLVPSIAYSGETGALMEGYSDLGGELVQLYYSSTGTTDWVHSSRNMISPSSVKENMPNAQREVTDANGKKEIEYSSPSSYAYPQKYQGAGYYTATEWDNRGVHHNSTVISHLGYVIYTNAIQDADAMTELLYRTWSYLSATSGFIEYRVSMMAAARDMKLSDNQKDIIAKAFDEANIKGKNYYEYREDRIQYGTPVAVYVYDAGGDAIPGAKIEINFRDGISTAYANDNGKIEIGCFANFGTYSYTVSASGYFSEYGTLTLSDRNLITITVYLQKTSNQWSNIRAEFGGKVRDAMTNEPVPNAQLVFRKGIDTTSGRSVLVKTTDEDGYYYADDLDYGYYTVEVTADGYIKSYGTVIAAAFDWNQDIRTQALHQDFVISPHLETDDTLRIVLTWDEDPRDIDSHIKGTLSDGYRFHVFFHEKSAYNPDGSLVANLDIDDTTSYGPETVTLHWASGVEYHYFVHLYAGWGTLSTSGAKLKIYSGATLLWEISVPEGSGSSDYWDVFTFMDGEFTFINTFSNYEP